MILMQAIQNLVPGAKVCIRGTQLEWLEQPAVMPTDAEIAAEVERINLNAPRDAIIAQITQMEQEQMLPRVTREALLGIAVIQAAAQGVTEPELYAVNVAYHKTKDFDDAIVLLRKKMEAI
jgi:hypothetical protein